MCHQLDISDWGTPEVVEWITELGYPEYAPMFEEQCVEGYMLVGLTLDDLVTSFRVDKMGHRNAMLRAVRRLLFSDVSPANIKRIDEPTLVGIPCLIALLRCLPVVPLALSISNPNFTTALT
jgi:hypothetical protein